MNRPLCTNCGFRHDPATSITITVTEKYGGDVILIEHFCDWDCLARYYRRELGKP